MANYISGIATGILVAGILDVCLTGFIKFLSRVKEDRKS